MRSTIPVRVAAACGLLSVFLLASPPAAGTNVDFRDYAAFARGEPLVRFDYANDFFVDRDYYYTQGLGLVVFADDARGFVVRHTGFTPTSLRSDRIRAGDRPFAAYLVAGPVRVVRLPDRRQTITLALDAGILGPSAGGEWMQTEIHRATGNLLPHGWDNQIRDDLALDLYARIDQAIWSGHRAEVGLFLDATAGTLYSNTAAGLAGRFQALGNGRRRLLLTASAEEKAVLFDATMQGGLFNRSSVYTLEPEEIVRRVRRWDAGVTVDLGRFAIDARRVWRGREFTTGRDHAWVEIGILRRF